MEKSYGVFKICYNTYQYSSTDERNNQVIHLVFGESWWTAECTGFLGNRRGIFDSKADAQREASDLRWTDRESRRNERCAYHKYAHRFFIHECDAKGNYIPSKAEIKKAVKYYIDNNLQWCEKIDTAVRTYAAENKIA